MALDDKSGTEVESQTIRRVDDEEEECHSGTIPNRRLELNDEGLVDVHVIEIAEDLLIAEGLRGADSGNHFFGHVTTISDVLQGQSGAMLSVLQNVKDGPESHSLLILGNELLHQATSNRHTREDRRHRESQPPLTGIRECETREEGSEEADSKRDFLRGGHLHKICYGSANTLGSELHATHGYLFGYE